MILDYFGLHLANSNQGGGSPPTFQLGGFPHFFFLCGAKESPLIPIPLSQAKP